MTGDPLKYQSCPLPGRSVNQSEAVRRMLDAQRVAVVGLSDDPSRPSFGVAKYLQSVGKEIIPINPKLNSVLGVKCYARLEDVPGQIDLVDVFRRPEFCPQIVRSAIGVKAGGVWLQSGVISAEAEMIAREAKMPFVQDRCLMVEHIRG